MTLPRRPWPRSDPPGEHEAGIGPAAKPSLIRSAWPLDVRRPSAVAGRSLVVVDDVATTGAQLCAVADVLRAHGAADITALVLAVARPRDQP
jgi:hypoxanthine phosphoribosyltransferase